MSECREVPISQLCAKAHTIKVAMVASRWQCVGDFIGSRFESHTSRTRSEHLFDMACFVVAFFGVAHFVVGPF